MSCLQLVSLRYDYYVMSTSKTRWCDCCGVEIPYDKSRVHMEYDGWTCPSLTYVAEDNGNPDFCYHSQYDKIHGLISLNMRREPVEKTIVNTEHFDGARCRDICPKCKIKFLESCIAYLKRYELKD